MANESRPEAAGVAEVWLRKLTEARGADLGEIAEYLAALEVENDRARRECIELRARLAAREAAE